MGEVNIFFFPPSTIYNDFASNFSKQAISIIHRRFEIITIVKKGPGCRIREKDEKGRKVRGKRRRSKREMGRLNERGEVKRISFPEDLNFGTLRTERSTAGSSPAFLFPLSQVKKKKKKIRGDPFLLIVNRQSRNELSSFQLIQTGGGG